MGLHVSLSSSPLFFLHCSSHQKKKFQPDQRHQKNFSKASSPPAAAGGSEGTQTADEGRRDGCGHHGELVAVGAVPAAAGAGGEHLPRLHHPLPVPLRQPAQGHARRDPVDRPLPQICPVLQVSPPRSIRSGLRPLSVVAAARAHHRPPRWHLQAARGERPHRARRAGQGGEVRAEVCAPLLTFLFLSGHWITDQYGLLLMLLLYTFVKWSG